MRPVLRCLGVLGTTTILIGLTTAPAHLQNPPAIMTLAEGAGSTVSQLRQADTLVTQLVREGSLRLLAQQADRLVAGRSHERFQQHHVGVPVFGADITRQSAGGVTVSLFGTLHLAVELDTTPALSVDDAAAIMARVAGQPLGGTATRPNLTVLPGRTAEGGYRLVYEGSVFTGTQLMTYFIDATTGDLVWAFDDLKTQQPNLPCGQCLIGDGIGVGSDRKKMSVTTVGGAFQAYDQLRPARIFTFDMRGDSQRALNILSGLAPLFDADLATDDDNQWLDGASVDAHVGMGWTYDYLFRRFGRRGLNNGDIRMISLVHPIDRADLSSAPPGLIGLFSLNAFYCGICGPDGVGLVVFGEGLPPNVFLGGQQFNFFSGALDIVAHELAHGLTDFTSSLIIVDESGALNEAFSDIIGVGVEHYAEPLFQSGSGAADYLIGEDVVIPGGLRSLSDPQQFGDPDHYSLRFLGAEDNGGVHTNSLIATHAFYLAIEGGTNRVSGLRVTGVGANNRQQMEAVFYRAFTSLLTSNSNFSAARAATLQSARDLHGPGSQAERSLIEAWNAVGVN